MLHAEQIIENVLQHPYIFNMWKKRQCCKLHYIQPILLLLVARSGHLVQKCQRKWTIPTARLIAEQLDTYNEVVFKNNVQNGIVLTALQPAMTAVIGLKVVTPDANNNSSQSTDVANN